MGVRKRVFVTGVTGNQGGALSKYLLAEGHVVTGLTRNVNSEKAKYWKSKGVHLVKGNLDDPSTYQAALEGSDTAYLVQTLQSKKSEIRQAKRFIDAAVSNGVDHLVYSSVLGADLNTGVPHFDSKNEIEEYIRSSNIYYTVLRPASFFENHLQSQVARGIRKGKYVSPLNESCTQQMIGVDDIGKIAARVISMPFTYSKKTLSIATDENKVGNLPDLFSETTKIPVAYKKLPGFIVRLAMGKDLHKMFKFMNKNNFRVIDNIDSVRNEFWIKGDFKSWVDQNFAQKSN